MTHREQLTENRVLEIRTIDRRIGKNGPKGHFIIHIFTIKVKDNDMGGEFSTDRRLGEMTEFHAGF
jgi:hypothetical protein